jgi:hypothetical protein
MNLPRNKILLAPILAVLLAFLLVGAAQSFPSAQQVTSTKNASPQVIQTPNVAPTAMPTASLSTGNSNSSNYEAVPPSNAPMPTPAPTFVAPSLAGTSSNASIEDAPSPESTVTFAAIPAASTAASNSFLPLLFAAAALIVVVVAVLVVFSEKGFEKAQ